jgi:hypothetical protein
MSDFANFPPEHLLKFLPSDERFRQLSARTILKTLLSDERSRQLSARTPFEKPTFGRAILPT